MTDALPDEVEACDFLTLPNSQRRDKRRAQKPEYKNRKRSRDKALKSTVEYKTIKNAHAVEQRKNSESELCTNVAILDMETDPFDAESNAEIAPFCACIFWIDQTTGIEHEHVFWNDDSHALIKELYSFI